MFSVRSLRGWSRLCNYFTPRVAIINRSSFADFSYDSSVLVYRKCWFSSSNEDSLDIDTDSIDRRLIRYERGLELLDVAEQSLRNEDYLEAEKQYSVCINTFSAYLAFKFPNEKIETLVVKQAEILAEPTIGLAFAQHCNGKLEEARENYKRALEWMKNMPEKEDSYARNLLNYAELLCQMEKPVTAFENCEKALPLIEKHYGKGELYASGLSNMATYLGIQQKFERGIPYAKEALDLFSKELGKNNGYTDGALEIYLRLLRDSGRTEEADHVFEGWQLSRKQAELPPPEKLSEDISNILTESLKPFAQKQFLDPKGIFVSPEILSEEKKQFEQIYKDSDFSKEQFLESLQTELSDLKQLVNQSPQPSKTSKPMSEDELLEELATGTTRQIASIDLDKYYKSKNKSTK